MPENGAPGASKRAYEMGSRVAERTCGLESWLLVLRLRCWTTLRFRRRHRLCCWSRVRPGLRSWCCVFGRRRTARFCTRSRRGPPFRSRRRFRVHHRTALRSRRCLLAKWCRRTCGLRMNGLRSRLHRFASVRAVAWGVVVGRVVSGRVAGRDSVRAVLAWLVSGRAVVVWLASGRTAVRSSGRVVATLWFSSVRFVSVRLSGPAAAARCSGAARSFVGRLFVSERALFAARVLSGGADLFPCAWASAARVSAAVG